MKLKTRGASSRPYNFYLKIFPLTFQISFCSSANTQESPCLLRQKLLATLIPRRGRDLPFIPPPPPPSLLLRSGCPQLACPQRCLLPACRCKHRALFQHLRLAEIPDISTCAILHKITFLPQKKRFPEGHDTQSQKSRMFKAPGECCLLLSPFKPAQKGGRQQEVLSATKQAGYGPHSRAALQAPIPGPPVGSTHVWGPSQRWVTSAP